MRVEVRIGDLFETTGDALLVQIDGQRPGLEGSLLHRLDRLYPEAELLEEVRAEVEYPLAYGSAQIVEVDELPYARLVVLSCLDHPTDSNRAVDRSRMFEAAVSRGLQLCVEAGLEHVFSPLLSGGWRLSKEKALRILDEIAGRTPGPGELIIIVREADKELAQK